MLDKHFELCTRSLVFDDIMQTTSCTNAQGEALELEQGIHQILTLFTERRADSTFYLIGNGGSAAVASHAVTDFMNVCQLRAFTLHESALITCMANDFGYDQAYKRLLKTVLRKNDVLIAISSSGKSPNICNAAKMAKSLGNIVITLSGFQTNNPLRQLGDFNFWLDSCDYGLVEIGHLFLLHNLADRDREAIALKDKEKEACVVSLT